MRHEVDPVTFAVRIFEDGATVPFWFQPDYPNLDKFDSVAEATTWAELAIASHTDPNAPFAPNGKGLAGEPKISAVEAQKAADRMAGIAILKAAAPNLTDSMLNAMLS